MSNIKNKEVTGNKRGPKGPSKWTKKKIEALADDMLEFFAVNKESFQLNEWGLNADVLPQRMTEFSKDNVKFAEALKKTRILLETRVVNMAHVSRNPAFGIFNLKANYGWQDKQVIEQTTEMTVKGSFAEAIKELGDVK